MTRLQVNEIFLQNALVDMHNARTRGQMVKAMNRVARLRAIVRRLSMQEAA